MTARRRLQISPFNPKLLPAILPPPVLKTATNISYHTLQTFPEKNYGYIELPVMEAEKIKKKLNGSILKGSKMRIETAHPEKASKRAREEEVADKNDAGGKKPKKPKSTKAEGVLPGYELPENRTVKRGWTEPPSMDSKERKSRKGRSDKKARPKKSSFTDKPECLFKTLVPPNGATLENTIVAGDGKRKKRKRGESDRATVVHEFENTTKHASFLRSDKSVLGIKTVSKFVDDVGWVDKDGNVVEAVPKSRGGKPDTNKKSTTPDDTTRNATEKINRRLPVPSRKSDIEDDETSSSGMSSSDSESDGNGENKPTSFAASPVPQPNSGNGPKATEMPSASSANSKISLPHPLTLTRSSATPPASPSTQLEVRQVHPLEVLFKRPTNPTTETPKKPALEVRTSFSFSDPQDGEENAKTKLLAPQTPFTQQDFRQRSLRSAAPTPDTAAPGKTFNFGFGGADEDEEGSDEDDDNIEENTAHGDEQSNGGTPSPKKRGAAHPEKEESGFEKWFWEHRGETNRAWKRRRREAAKEKRQKENRERGGRKRVG